MPAEIQPMLVQAVRQARERSGLGARQALKLLGVPPSTYYGLAKRRSAVRPRSDAWNVYAALPAEREAVIGYALAHPELRHRELAWRMVDEDVAYLSPSSVYRILLAADLVQRWEKKGKKEKAAARKVPGPDQRWQSDIKLVRIGGRDYPLVTFLDCASRAIPYHELMLFMDGRSVSLAAETALSALPEGAKPDVQTDNGSGYISLDFGKVLKAHGVGHFRIYPHCPQQNGLIERSNRTLGVSIAEHDLLSFEHAKEVIAQIIEHYNHVRLHSAIGFLPPWTVYRGDPEKALAERKGKLQKAREERRQRNLGIRQGQLDLNQNSCYQTKETVSCFET